MDLSSIRVQHAITFGRTKTKFSEVVMKYAKWMLAATLMMLPGLAAAQLHSSDTIVAKVPFEFVVANKVVPAGKCELQSATDQARTIMIRNIAAKMGLFSQATRDDSKETAGSYALVFNKQGDRYFLRGIKLEGSRITYRLPESKAEAELRAQNVSSSELVLLASLK
jgi:hypothetical protein